MANFVKFQRGTQSAYDSLTRKSPDTLYFIIDDNEKLGKLYLGNKLISGDNINNNVSLSELSDIVFPNDFETNQEKYDGSILKYHVSDQKWYLTENSQTSDTSSPVIPVGQTNGSESLSDAQNRIGGQSPEEGKLIVVNDTLYYYNGENWTSLMSSSNDAKINQLEEKITELENSIDNKIANANHLRYEVLETEEELDNLIANPGTASLANTIYLIKNPDVDDSSFNQYNEYLIHNNKKELLGSWQANLDSYVTTNTFNTKVGQLESSIHSLDNRISTLESNLDNKLSVQEFNNFKTNVIGDLSALLAEGEESTTIVDKILEIDTRLQWNDIAEE